MSIRNWFKKTRTSVVLTVPEGLDIWSNSPAAKESLERAEQLTRDIVTKDLSGVVVPFGWELSTLEVTINE